MGHGGPRVGVQRPVDDLGDTMRRRVEHVLVGGPAGRIGDVLGGSGHRDPPRVRVPDGAGCAAVAAAPSRGRQRVSLMVAGRSRSRTVSRTRHPAWRDRPDGTARDGRAHPRRARCGAGGSRGRTTRRRGGTAKAPHRRTSHVGRLGPTRPPSMTWPEPVLGNRPLADREATPANHPPTSHVGTFMRGSSRTVRRADALAWMAERVFESGDAPLDVSVA